MTKNILLYTLIFFVLSCSNQLEEKSLFLLSNDLNIGLNQNVDQNGPYLTISLVTKDKVECSNANFDYEFANQKDQIELNIKDLVLNEPCNNIQDLVKSNIPLKAISTNNDITIIIKSLVENKGVIKFSDQKYSLSFETQEGFSIGKSTILQIPNNAVWGTIYLNNLTSDVEKNKLIELLDSFKTNEVDLRSGDYGLFQYFGNDIKIDNVVPSENEFSFFIQIDDWDTFKIAMNDFFSQSDILAFSIRNYLNQQL